MYKHILLFLIYASWAFLIIFISLLITSAFLIFSHYYCTFLIELGLHSFLVHIVDFCLCAFLDWALSMPLHLILMLVLFFYFHRHPNFSFTDLFKSSLNIPSWIWSSGRQFSILDALVTILGLLVLLAITIWHFA